MFKPLGLVSLLLLLTSTVNGLYRWRNDEIEAIRTEELLTIEGVEFKRAEARVEAQQHAGMYSFIASKTGGLAVFIIGDNEDNFTQVGLTEQRTA